VRNIKSRVPAEVFVWHPQQRQLRGNTQMKHQCQHKILSEHYNINKLYTVQS